MAAGIGSNLNLFVHLRAGKPCGLCAEGATA
jgi:hypothetical protein